MSSYDRVVMNSNELVNVYNHFKLCYGCQWCLQWVIDLNVVINHALDSGAVGLTSWYPLYTIKMFGEKAMLGDIMAT